MSAKPEKREGWRGQYTLQILSDGTGAITVNGQGNLSVQEVLLGVEVFKASLLKGAQMAGRATVPGLDPKRF